MNKAAPEGKMKAECRTWLRSQGAYIFSPVTFGTAATLDDLVCYLGHFVGLEYKRPDTCPPPTPRQKFIIEQIRAAGGHAWVVYSLNELQAFWNNVF